MGVEPKIGGKHPKWIYGWFIMENPIKMDDLGVPLFLETPISFPSPLVFHKTILDYWWWFQISLIFTPTEKKEGP